MDSFPDGFTYRKETLPDGTSLVFIKEISNELSAKAWLQEWSDLSKVTWRISRTYPRSGRHNCFKVDMKCQHAADNRVRKVNTKKLHTKKTGCSAFLQIKISREKEQNEWPTIVTLRGYHNHPLENSESLKYRDMGSDTREKLISLFKQGHKPSSALHCLKNDLLIEHGEEYYKYAYDGKYVPSLSIVYHLFYKEFSKKVKNVTKETVFQQLNQKLKDYTTKGSGKAIFSFTQDKKHYFIVICSPIMLRVQEIVPEANEIVLVKSLKGMKNEKHRLYLFITPTAAGGVPLAAIISNSEEKVVFDESIVKLKEIVRNSTFKLKNLEPQVLMVDNHLIQSDCLSKHFPNSKLLLCQFNLLKEVWSWLQKQPHKIDSQDRQEVFFLFKNILYSKTEKEFIRNHEVLKNNEIVKKYSNFLDYYQKLFYQKEDWVTYHRKSLTTGSNTTNYVEIMFRIIKKSILNQIKELNLSQLFDFIVTQLETYFQKKLLNYCHNIYDLDDSMKEADVIVNVSNNTCFCLHGDPEQLCKHTMFSSNEIQDGINTSFKNSDETSKNMFYVASGLLPPAEGFGPLRYKPIELPFFPNVSEDSNSTDSLFGGGEEDNNYEDNSIEENSNYVNEKSSKYINNEENSDYITEEESSNYIYEEESSSYNSEENISNKKQKLNQDEKEALQHFCQRINDGLENDPDNYVPAVRKMMQNFQKTKTDASFLYALHSFGRNIDLKRTARKSMKK